MPPLLLINSLLGATRDAAGAIKAGVVIGTFVIGMPLLHLAKHNLNSEESKAEREFFCE